jgi:hypothetical protein
LVLGIGVGRKKAPTDLLELLLGKSNSGIFLGLEVNLSLKERIKSSEYTTNVIALMITFCDFLNWCCII